MDAMADEWPYLLVRDLKIDPDDRLDTILSAHFPNVSVDTLDPIFTSELMKRLAHLVINAILYTTSADVKTEIQKT